MLFFILWWFVENLFQWAMANPAALGVTWLLVCVKSPVVLFSSQAYWCYYSNVTWMSLVVSQIIGHLTFYSTDCLAKTSKLCISDTLYGESIGDQLFLAQWARNGGLCLFHDHQCLLLSWIYNPWISEAHYVTHSSDQHVNHGASFPKTHINKLAEYEDTTTISDIKNMTIGKKHIHFDGNKKMKFWLLTLYKG